MPQSSTDKALTPSEERCRLTGKQRAFIDAYLGPARFNATEAAAMAGYSGDRRTLASVGSENLRKPNILREVERRWAAHGVTEAEVVMHLADWMRFDIACLFDEHGNIRWDQVREHGEHIRKVKWVKGQRVEVEVHDPMRAAENIARVLGMFREVREQEHTGELTVTFRKPEGQT